MSNKLFVRAFAATCIATAVTASSSSASSTCPPDINNDSIVNASDLLAVINAWGWCGSCAPDIAPAPGDGRVNSTDLIAVVGSWGQCAGTPNPPPPPGLTPSGPISLGDGASTITNKFITGTFGIKAGNDKHVTLLTVDNCIIQVDNAGIYASPCDQAIVTHTQIVSNGNPDPYSVRGTFHNWTSSDCSFHGDKAWRIYDLIGGSSTRDTFTGTYLWLGGGSADAWQNPLDFDNFIFRDGHIGVDSVEIMDATNDVTFSNMNFAGTDHISIQAGAYNIVFFSCHNVPDIRLYDAAHNQIHPSPAELALRGIVLP